MKISPKTFLLAIALCAWTNALASTLKISPNSSVRSTSEVEANYSTTHVFVNEVAGDSIPITIFFDPQTFGVQTCEVFTNLNRRDRAGLDANNDGIEDGIIPPGSSAIVANSDAHYFKAYTMSGVSGGYQLTLPAQKTGAYRLTVRWRLTSDAAGTYRFYNNETGADGKLRRDHAIVVSPKSARDIQLYEANPLTITATGTLPSQRGTFASLANGVSGGPRFSLQYVKDLGCNMLWFQPIHPNGIDGRQTDPTTGQPFEVGSPYAVKNFFEVMPLMASGFNPGGTPATNDTLVGRSQAMAEFQTFAQAADAAGVGIMLDAPFNHTSYDTELAAIGQTLFGNSGTTASSQMRNVEARFFARADNYDMRASSSTSIALAPDRIDFGKFADTFEVYYGRYAALVSGSTPGYKSELDWFDFSIGSDDFAGDGNGHFDLITQEAWRYFASYLDFWLTQTGYPANPSGASLNSTVGIDALRADFGQGLPPQCWEYIINKTRTRKWNLVFMAESLDGGEVTYRSARHFDVLNENIVFPFHAATTVPAYRSIFEDRRNQYGQALVLLNTSSHDEDHYQDPYEALIRYAISSTEDGVPLIFPGQELGLSGVVVPPGDTQKDSSGNPAFPPYGYDRYETNFGKPIPHFKKYNSLMPLWLKTQPGSASYNYGLAQLAPVFSGIGQARKFSPALRSSNRHFLNLTDSTPHGQIFSVAKFEQRNSSPVGSDVVFAFVNIARNADPETTGARFNLNVDTDGNGVNDFGLKTGRRYNVRNIGAYLGVDNTRRDQLLLPGGNSGAELLSQGLYVKLNRVPATDAAWATAPYEPQFLKLYDVTAPVLVPAQPAGPNVYAYAVGNSVTFTWPAVAADSEGVTPRYRVILAVNGVAQAPTLVNSTTYTRSGLQAGDLTSITVAAVNPTDPSQSGPVSSSSATVEILNPELDNDHDGATNVSEDTAGTNPLDASSLFKILNISRTAVSSVDITWSSVPGRKYEVWTSEDLLTPFVRSSGATPINSAGAQTTFHDNAASDSRKFYEVRVVTP